MTPHMAISQGDPAVDSKAFRHCLGQYPTGVTVITARDAEQLVGMAVNSFAAVSLAPPLVLWSIRRESRSAQAFLRAGHFGISILAVNQVDVAQSFGAGLADRFEKFTWHAGVGGAPLLDGAIAHLECSTESLHDGGDHHILVGRVQRYSRFEGAPLVFAQGQYAVTQNHPHVAAQASVAEGRAISVSGVPLNFLRGLSVASQRLSTGFQVYRDELALTPSMARVLAVLHESPSCLDELEHSTYLGRLSLNDALADMCSQGLVVRTAGGMYQLSVAGHHKREAMTQRSERYLNEKLHGISTTDIEAAGRVISALQHS